MRNTFVLEMINEGKIEELKRLLQDEIYEDSLKKSGNASKRYAAMKRYIKYCGNLNESMKFPCKDVSAFGNTYNSFIDGYSCVLTTESIGELESFDKSKGKYFDVASLMNYSKASYKDVINFSEILAKAKMEGYKFSAKEYSHDFKYLLHYKDAYYKIGLLDKAYSIIDNGESSDAYYTSRKSPLYIKNEIGFVCILPININSVSSIQDKIIINVD